MLSDLLFTLHIAQYDICVLLIKITHKYTHISAIGETLNRDEWLVRRREPPSVGIQEHFMLTFLFRHQQNAIFFA